MGTLTLSQFRSELVFDLKNRSDQSLSTGFSVLRQNLFINAAYLHVTHPSVFRHRELQVEQTIALLSGTGAYTFSPLAGVVLTGIRYAAHVAALTNDPTAQHTKLFPHDRQWFMARTINSSGQPRDYATLGDQITLSPVPGANEVGEIIVLGGIREPTLLSADTDTTIIANRFDEIVLLAARWRAELHLGYRDQAEATKFDFVSLLNEYKDHEQLHGEDWDWQSDLVSESHMETV